MAVDAVLNVGCAVRATRGAPPLDVHRARICQLSLIGVAAHSDMSRNADANTHYKMVKKTSHDKLPQEQLYRF